MPILDTETLYMGRKAKFGAVTLIRNNHTREVCRFLKYCPNCRHKILATLPELRQFTKRYWRRYKSLTNRALVRFMYGEAPQLYFCDCPGSCGYRLLLTPEEAAQIVHQTDVARNPQARMLRVMGQWLLQVSERYQPLPQHLSDYSKNKDTRTEQALTKY